MRGRSLLALLTLLIAPLTPVVGARPADAATFNYGEALQKPGATPVTVQNMELYARGGTKIWGNPPR